MEKNSKESIYMNIFQTLCESREQFTVDPDRAVEHLEKALDSIAPRNGSARDSSSCSDPADSPSETDNYVRDANTEKSTEHMCGYDEEEEEQQQGTNDIFETREPTDYKSSLIFDTIRRRRKKGEFPSYIDEKEFVCVPEEERIWSTAPQFNKQDQLQPSISSSAPSDANEPCLVSESYAMGTITSHNEVTSLPLPPSSVKLEKPPPVLYDCPYSTAHTESKKNSDTFPFDTTFPHLPEWVFESLKVETPPSKKTLTILTAYCWAGYHAHRETSARLKKQSWLELLNQQLRKP